MGYKIYIGSKGSWKQIMISDYEELWHLRAFDIIKIYDVHLKYD